MYILKLCKIAKEQAKIIALDSYKNLLNRLTVELMLNMHDSNFL